MSTNVLSYIKLGSLVQIATTYTIKNPELNGLQGRVINIPVHPSTWIKVSIISDLPHQNGQVHSFRTSALIPLSENGTIISAFKSQAREAAAFNAGELNPYDRTPSQKKEAQNYDIGYDPYSDEYDNHFSTTVNGKRSRKEPNQYTDLAYTKPSAKRPRSKKSAKVSRREDYVRGNYTYEEDYPVVKADFTGIEDARPDEQFRLLCEFSYASAYVPECANNTLTHGVIGELSPRSKHVVLPNACRNCGKATWRLSAFDNVISSDVPVHGYCWNESCTESPIQFIPKAGDFNRTIFTPITKNATSDKTSTTIGNILSIDTNQNQTKVSHVSPTNISGISNDHIVVSNSSRNTVTPHASSSMVRIHGSPIPFADDSVIRVVSSGTSNTAVPDSSGESSRQAVSNISVISPTASAESAKLVHLDEITVKSVSDFSTKSQQQPYVSPILSSSVVVPPRKIHRQLTLAPQYVSPTTSSDSSSIFHGVSTSNTIADISVSKIGARVLSPMTIPDPRLTTGNTAEEE